MSNLSRRSFLGAVAVSPLISLVKPEPIHPYKLTDEERRLLVGDCCTGCGVLVPEEFADVIVMAPIGLFFHDDPDRLWEVSCGRPKGKIIPG